MNREIKFRAWIKKEQSMVDIDTLEFAPDTDNPHGWVACPWEQGFNEDSETMEKDCVFKMEDIELMQYTGLKDKNGKEIYEGDIYVVRELHDGDEYIWNNEEQKGIPQLVIWDAKRCEFDFGADSRIRYQPNDFEVIGNIFENKELLND